MWLGFAEMDFVGQERLLTQHRFEERDCISLPVRLFDEAAPMRIEQELRPLRVACKDGADLGQGAFPGTAASGSVPRRWLGPSSSSDNRCPGLRLPAATARVRRSGVEPVWRAGTSPRIDLSAADYASPPRFVTRQASTLRGHESQASDLHENPSRGVADPLRCQAWRLGGRRVQLGRSARGLAQNQRQVDRPVLRSDRDLVATQWPRPRQLAPGDGGGAIGRHR